MGYVLNRIGALFLGALSLAGCSSPSEGGTLTSSTGPVTEDAAPARFGQTLCASMTACCQKHGFAHDTATCESSLEAQFKAVMLANHSAKIRYDPNAAGRCIDAYENTLTTCGDPGTTIDDACDAVWTGTVEVGGACSESEECKDTPELHAYCDQGVCVRDEFGSPPVHARAGQPCDETCTEDETSSGCSLSGSGQGGASTATGGCYTNEGLFCDDTTRTCVSLPKLGESCSYSSGCTPGAYCGNSICVAQQSSGPCTSDVACTSENYCDTSTPGNGIASAGSCTPKKADGATCEYQQECQLGHCANGICAARVAVNIELCAGLLGD